MQHGADHQLRVLHHHVAAAVAGDHHVHPRLRTHQAGTVLGKKTCHHNIIRNHFIINVVTERVESSKFPNRAYI